MCGIFGASLGRKAKIEEVATNMTLLLMLNDYRGKHSAGIANNNGYVGKKAITPVEFSRHEDYMNAFYKGKAEYAPTNFIGHTRFATGGSKTDENAHPFQVGNVVGTHNGWLPEWKKTYCNIMTGEAPNTLADQRKLMQEYYKMEEFDFPEVDSNAIYEVFAMKGYDVHTFPLWHGAVALAYIMTDDRRLYLHRREAKPLSIGYLGDTLYYSSEPYPLYAIGCNDVQLLEKDKLYTIDKGEIKGMINLSEPDVVLPTDLSPKDFKDHVPDDMKKFFNIYTPPSGGGRSYPSSRSHSTDYTCGYGCGYRGYGDEDEEEETYQKQGSIFNEERGSEDYIGTAYNNADNGNNNGVDKNGRLKVDKLTPLATFNKGTKDIDDKNAAILKLNFQNDEKKPFMNVTVYPFMTNAVMYVPNHTGSIAINLESEMFDKSKAVKEHKVDMVVVATDPELKADRMFKVCNLPLKKGAVSEVTVRIPFSVAEKKEEKNNNSTVEASSKDENIRPLSWPALQIINDALGKPKTFAGVIGVPSIQNRRATILMMNKVLEDTPLDSKSRRSFVLCSELIKSMYDYIEEINSFAREMIGIENIVLENEYETTGYEIPQEFYAFVESSVFSKLADFSDRIFETFSDGFIYADQGKVKMHYITRLTKDLLEFANKLSLVLLEQDDEE